MPSIEGRDACNSLEFGAVENKDLTVEVADSDMLGTVLEGEGVTFTLKR